MDGLRKGISMDLQEKLSLLPMSPGVYLMKDKDDQIIYVGKAINLRSRVRSYFQSSKHHGAKVKALVERIADFEYIVTDSEVEALILESNLIKKHSPWFNIRLKDDKSYPYIKVTTNEDFPRVMMVRNRLDDGAKYYGPYTNVTAVKSTLNFLRKLFPIRTCRKNIKVGQKPERPCLNYHIGRCLAPCAGLVDQGTYQEMIDEVCLFLEGRHHRLIPDLTKKMEKASAHLEFERAAKIRDQIRALEQMVEKQKIISQHKEDQDILGYARVGNLACVQVFFVRDGKLIGREHFMLDCNADEEAVEILTAFVKQYYSDASFIPKEILLPTALEDQELIEQWLSELKQARVYIRRPQRGTKKELVEMVNHNAEVVLEETRAREEQKSKEIERGLFELQQALNLSSPIQRIEAFDISTIQGSHTVASMVVMIDGVPANDQYRRFKIQSVSGEPNDYLAMEEVIRRRFTRGLREQAGELEVTRFSEFPDLVVIDGGKGQLSSAIKIRDELGLGITFIGLAEQFEEVYLENQSEPLILPRESYGLHMLQRIRDEAHRFALAYHRHLRSKNSHRSLLDEIPGVGPKRKKALLRHFGTVKRIREASVEELQEVEGINEKVATEIWQYVRK